MNNGYILIKESELDSRIGELRNSKYSLASPIIKELQSLKQKGEVVEVEEVDMDGLEMWERADNLLSYLKNNGYKLIKKV